MILVISTWGFPESQKKQTIFFSITFKRLTLFHIMRLSSFKSTENNKSEQLAMKENQKKE